MAPAASKKPRWVFDGINARGKTQRGLPRRPASTSRIWFAKSKERNSSRPGGSAAGIQILSNGVIVVTKAKTPGVYKTWPRFDPMRVCGRP
jgi:hypothetical protein